MKKQQSTGNFETSKEADFAPSQSTKDLLAKEEQYKLINEELEVKTADVVRQAEQLVKEQNEALSRPLPNLLADMEEKDNSRGTKHQPGTVQGLKAMSKKKMTSTSQSLYAREKKPHCKGATSDVSAEENAEDLYLAKAVQNIEEKINEAGPSGVDVDDVYDAEDNIGTGILDAQTRVLKAKLRIMQEELDQLSSNYYKKDDENSQLSVKIKELEEDRVRLQRTMNNQQSQIEKHKVLAEESSKKCEGLQTQLSTSNKEIENLNRAHKQAAAVHSTVEVRLNRAREEVAKLKTELKNTKQMTKDMISEEQDSKENLLAENKMLKKQKAELIVGFKRQLKLISILKRSKIHTKAARQLSITEEEFINALDMRKF